MRSVNYIVFYIGVMLRLWRGQNRQLVKMNVWEYGERKHDMSLKRMKRLSVSSLLLLLPAVLMAGDLASDFDTPPAAARPWVRWWWLDRQSEEGITLELEAVKEQGIGGVLIYACGGNILPDAVFGPREEYWTPEWLAMVEFAAREAKRLGLEVKFNNVATSSGSGGPWISIEDSGKKMVWSCKWIKGGSNVTVQLPQPEILDNYYLDTTVVAYPCPVDIDTMRQAAPELSASTSEFNADKVNLIVDADDTTHWSSLLETPGGEYIDITFDEDYTASSVYIVPRTDTLQPKPLFRCQLTGLITQRLPTGP